ncbi:hypothetical protein OIO90_005683 [Microbotryomycetes sp. JL221]|nr:hypothetical protein OIO90_005683 [Microbotryomycetes sp. JL221]
MRSTSFSHKGDRDSLDLELELEFAREKWETIFSAQRAPVARGSNMMTPKKQVRPGHVRRASTNSIADLLQATRLDERPGTSKEVTSDHEATGDSRTIGASILDSYPSRPGPTASTDQRGKKQPLQSNTKNNLGRSPSSRLRSTFKSGNKLVDGSPAIRQHQQTSTAFTKSSMSAANAIDTALTASLLTTSLQQRAPVTSSPRRHGHRRKRSSTLDPHDKQSSGRTFFSNLVRSKKSASSLKKTHNSADLTPRPNRINASAISARPVPGRHSDELLISMPSSSHNSTTNARQTEVASLPLPKSAPSQSKETEASELGLLQSTWSIQSRDGESDFARQRMASNTSDTSSSRTVMSENVSFTQAGLLSLPSLPMRRFSEESSRSNLSTALSEPSSTANKSGRPTLSKLSTSPNGRSMMSSLSSPPNIFPTALSPPPRPAVRRRPATAPSPTTALNSRGIHTDTTTRLVREPAIRESLRPTLSQPIRAHDVFSA